jgi:hypothetical protein
MVILEVTVCDLKLKQSWKNPFAQRFAEHGVLMLSGALNSRQAFQVNI